MRAIFFLQTCCAFPEAALAKEEAGQPVSGLEEAWIRGIPVGGSNPLPSVGHSKVPALMGSCLSLTCATSSSLLLPSLPLFSCLPKQTSVLPLASRSIVRLRQEKVTQCVYTHVQGQQSRWVRRERTNSVRLTFCKVGSMHGGRRRRQRSSVSGCHCFLTAQEATHPTGSLKTPGGKPSFPRAELLKILLNS